MKHVDLDIAGTSFRRLSMELERLSLELRDSEEAIHRIVEAAPWSKVSEEVTKIQSLDLLIQTLTALSQYAEKMAYGVDSRVDHDLVVSNLTLEGVRERLTGDVREEIEAKPKPRNEIELF